MRLHSALVLLVSTVPALSQEDNAVQYRESNDDEKFLQSLVVGNSRSIFEERRKRRGAAHVLKDRKFPMQEKDVLENNRLVNVECNPKSDDADLGVLSCGTTMYCAETITSSLGGICKPLSYDNNNINNENAMAEERRLAEDFCTHLKGGNFFDTCDCTNFDTATQSGTIECFKEDDCFHDFGLDDLCATLYARFDANADGSYTYEYSYDFHSPYDRSYVFEYAFPESTCKITVDSQPCNHCEETDECGMKFDCSNTAAGTKRLACGELVNVLPIFDDLLNRGQNAAEMADANRDLDTKAEKKVVKVHEIGGSGCRSLQSKVAIGIGLGVVGLLMSF